LAADLLDRECLIRSQKIHADIYFQLELSVSDGNAHVAVGNYYEQQSEELGNQWNFPLSNNTFPQNGFYMPSAIQEHYPQIQTSADFNSTLHYHLASPETHCYVPPLLPVLQLARIPTSNPMTIQPSHSVCNIYHTRDHDSTSHLRH
jgi:hypothetical protein